jgi:phosphotransferase system enzyme I (PtsI)
LPERKDVAKGLLKGIPVSEGIAIGEVWILETPWDEVVSYSLDKDNINTEKKRYQRAIKEVAQQLVDCKNRVSKEIGEEEARIFEAHLTILNDPFFQREIPESIQISKTNAESLLKDGIERIETRFSSMDNEFFQARVDDIRDVAMRILRVLLQTEEVKYPHIGPVILVAHRLAPSDTARVDKDKILGFATEMGGETSHASLLARSFGLPAVVGIEKLIPRVNNGDTIIIDGNAGIVYINPPQKVIKGYQKLQKQFQIYLKHLDEEVKLPSVTQDGMEISLQANVAMTADVSMAVRYQADGIGLFRTELPFLIAGRLLTGEEQFKIYHAVVEALKGKRVTIRTLDLGGDKFLPFQNVEQERNPFLGWRSIRIFLQERDLFKIQIRAILRASHYGKVRILFPMISSIEEITEIQSLLDEVKEEMKKEGVPFDESIQSGIMVEVPSVAILAKHYIEFTDHFSIGTNDLIQYTLAVDRNNEKVAKFYNPMNPAVLSLVQQTIQAALDAGKTVSLCGEIAGNPIFTPLLLGFGLREYSMSPLMLPEVKERIRAVNINECEELTKTVRSLISAKDIEEALWQFHLKANKRQPVPFIAQRNQLALTEKIFGKTP